MVSYRTSTDPNVLMKGEPVEMGFGSMYNLRKIRSLLLKKQPRIKKRNTCRVHKASVSLGTL